MSLLDCEDYNDMNYSLPPPEILNVNILGFVLFRSLAVGTAVYASGPLQLNKNNVGYSLIEKPCSPRHDNASS